MNLYESKRGCGKPIDGPPTLFYIVVMERSTPTIRPFVTLDGVYKFTKTHEEDRKRGYDWGPYAVYVVSTDPISIQKCEVAKLTAEMERLIQVEAKERFEAIEKERVDRIHAGLKRPRGLARVWKR